MDLGQYKVKQVQGEEHPCHVCCLGEKVVRRHVTSAGVHKHTTKWKCKLPPREGCPLKGNEYFSEN